MSQQLLTEQHKRLPNPQAEAKPARPAQTLSRRYGSLWPAFASALLLWLCYFPLNAGWLAWTALVPMLCLVRSSARPRTIYFGAWMAGLAFFFVALQWVRVADNRMYATWLGLAFWCSFFVVAGIYLIRRLDRSTSFPLVLTVPIVWTALEFARAYLLTGFPWYYLGHSQHDFLAVIQISDLGGAYAVTFIVAAVNGCLFEFLYTRLWFRRLTGLPAEAVGSSRHSLVWQFLAVLLMLASTLGYGAWRLSQSDFEKGPVVALLQGNLDQRLRNLASGPGGTEEAIDKMQRHYKKLCDQAAHSGSHPQLIVWPETSFLYDWEEVSPELRAQQIPEGWKKAEGRRKGTARTASEIWGANLLVGLNAYVLHADTCERRYNSAVLITADGASAGRYDKMHCVPFGEYVPLRDWLPWMNKFAPYDFDYSVTPGKEFTRFPLGAYNFGVVICYEDTDPGLAREYVRPASAKPAADFLINISNDGWFDGTSEHEEHLAICRFRAVECRRALARAVNMGISAVVDGNGRVIALPGANWEKSKKVEAVVSASIPIDRRCSLYAQWGDWLSWSCWMAIGAGFLWGIFRPLRV